MNNDITINIEYIRNLPDGCIDDAKTIRQISLYSIKHNDKEITKKINPMYAVHGLYPLVVETLDQITYPSFPDSTMTKDMLSDIFKDRKRFKEYSDNRIKELEELIKNKDEDK